MQRLLPLWAVKTPKKICESCPPKPWWTSSPMACNTSPTTDVPLKLGVNLYAPPTTFLKPSLPQLPQSRWKKALVNQIQHARTSTWTSLLQWQNCSRKPQLLWLRHICTCLPSSVSSTKFTPPTTMSLATVPQRLELSSPSTKKESWAMTWLRISRAIVCQRPSRSSSHPISSRSIRKPIRCLIMDTPTLFESWGLAQET